MCGYDADESSEEVIMWVRLLSPQWNMTKKHKVFSMITTRVENGATPLTFSVILLEVNRIQ